MTLKESVQSFVAGKKAYYRQWIFDQPVVLSNNHHLKLARLQKVLAKLIHHFVIHYEDFQHLMPLGPASRKVLELHKGKPYKIGTYRTDFVYDHQNQVRLLEITCRFSLNGMFLSAVMNDIADDLLVNSGSQIQTTDVHSGIYGYLEELIGGARRVLVLKGSDRRNESKLFGPIFEQYGLPVQSLELEEIDTAKSLFKDSFIVTELGLEEITRLKAGTISALSESNMINDFRTVFLVHDKRFFSVLYNKEFRNSVLSSEEEAFFKNFLIPTHNYSPDNPAWTQAKKDKRHWIIKHATLGKSQQVYAGVVTPQQEWDELFSTDMSHMVLQEWIDTDTIQGTIGEEKFEDYITGTIIYFDDHYFGLGDFRTSSFPVTNKTDHRKACTLILNEEMRPGTPKLKYVDS